MPLKRSLEMVFLFLISQNRHVICICARDTYIFLSFLDPGFDFILALKRVILGGIYLILT